MEELYAKAKMQKWRDLSQCHLALPVQMTAFLKFPSLTMTVRWWQWRKNSLCHLSDAWSVGSAALGWDTAVVQQMQAGIGGAWGCSQACSSSMGSVWSPGAYFATGCISASCVITLNDTWMAERCFVAGRQNLWRLRKAGKPQTLLWNAELHLTMCFIQQIAGVCFICIPSLFSYQLSDCYSQCCIFTQQHG